MSRDHGFDGPLALLFVLSAVAAGAQAPEEKIVERLRNDSDPTRAVLFSICLEFSWLTADVMP